MLNCVLCSESLRCWWGQCYVEEGRPLVDGDCVLHKLTSGGMITSSTTAASKPWWINCVP